MLNQHPQGTRRPGQWQHWKRDSGQPGGALVCYVSSGDRPLSAVCSSVCTPFTPIEGCFRKPLKQASFDDFSIVAAADYLPMACSRTSQRRSGNSAP